MPKPRTDKDRERDRLYAQARKERIANDPEFAAKIREQQSAWNAARRDKRRLRNDLPEDLRERLKPILGTYPEKGEALELQDWHRSDIYCPKCPGDVLMLADKRFVWCGECGYEVRGMLKENAE